MRSNQCEVSPDSCRTSIFQEYVTRCYCYQVPIQSTGIEEPTPYLTGKLHNKGLLSIDSTFQHITLLTSTSPKTLSTTSVTSETTKLLTSRYSTTPATSLSNSKTVKPLTISYSSTITAVSTSLTSTPLPSTPDKSTSLTSTSLPSTPDVSTSLTSTSLPSTPDVSTSLTSTSLPSTPDVSTSLTSTPLPSTPDKSTSLTSTSLPSTPDVSTSLTSTSLPSTPEVSTSLTSTSLPSTPDVSTSLTSTSLPSTPYVSTSLTSTPLTSILSKATKPLTKSKSSTTSQKLAVTSVGEQSTIKLKSTPLATLSTCVTSNTANQSTLSKPSTTFATLTTTATTFSRLSQLVVLLLMSIPSVVSFPTQRIGTYVDDNVSLHVKQHTPSMTIKLSFLDQRLNETTTAETKSVVHINDSLSQADKGQHLSSPILMKLANMLKNPSTYSPLSDVSGTHSSQFVTESDNDTNPLDFKPTSVPISQSVNLAVIPVLGIFFLMVILWTKCSTWFRDHLRDQDLEDDGKEYVILNPPEDGYREVEFRSDTSSMYYDTVSSYRSIFRQKVEYGGFNNYDTVTSIRSILQRADVRDAAVQVKLQGEHLKTDRWKSVSGILNNSGSSSDLLKVPKKTHRQVSFQTSQNEIYDPPLQQTCDANIQVGDSSTERMKIGEKNKVQTRLLQKPVDTTLTSGIVVSKYFDSGTQLSIDGSKTSLIGLDEFDVPYPSTSPQVDDATSHQETSGGSCGGGGGEYEGSVGETSSYSGVSSVTSKDEPAQCEIINPKHRRVHQFQVLRVDSSDGIYKEPLQSNDSELASETTDVSEKESTLPTDTSQDDYSIAQPLPHPHHYLCRRLKEAKRRSKDPTAPIADSISDFKPPIFSEVKFGQPPSDEDDECDYRDDINLQVKHNKQRDCMFSEKLFIEENSEDSCWCEQSIDSGEEDKLNQLLEAHASSVAGAPRASPISMHSSASSCTLSSHSSCSSLEAIKDEINEDGGVDGRGLDPPQDGSSYIAQGMYAEEETPLIMELAGDSPCHSPEIYALARQRGHRSSSGYDTQGHETPSPAKGHVPETGDTSCDVTPLTSSTNSLHDCCDGKRYAILAEAHSTQHPLSSHVHHQPLPHPHQHPRHHHHHHHHHHPHQQQQQQQQDQLPEVSQDAVRVPSYIPHSTYRSQDTRHEDNNNNDSNSLRRSIIERNRCIEDQRSNVTSTSGASNTNDDNSHNNDNSINTPASRSSSSSSTVGGRGNNNNNNNNTSENKIDMVPDAESHDMISTDAGVAHVAESKTEPTDFKKFHRKPVPPILCEKEPFLLPSNHINPTTPPTADVHLPNTKRDYNIEIV